MGSEGPMYHLSPPISESGRVGVDADRLALLDRFAVARRRWNAVPVGPVARKVKVTATRPGWRLDCVECGHTALYKEWAMAMEQAGKHASFRKQCMREPGSNREAIRYYGS
jgi:hypothetical protein